jgi:SAM-dependent methyltransferase
VLNGQQYAGNPKPKGKSLPGWKLAAKRAFFPGLDLHTRCRYRFLPEYIRAGSIDTLDAGSGNGALSYSAYRKGNRVLGVSLDQRSVDDTAALFRYIGIPQDTLQFLRMNVYDLGSLGRKFHQIICGETLEHIRRDREVVQLFADLLIPGGQLLLCCPHALHPEHNLGRTDEPETGGHVRDGYTLESYRALLQPAGFRITGTLGIGSPLLCRLNKLLRGIRDRVGDLGAFPVYFLLLPLTWLDYPAPKMPFSLAVIAEKV